jgi:predicted transcriptional regulator YheO
MRKQTPEQTALLEQLKSVARGVSETFAPFCEVVVHDLRDPKHAIVAIENNLSGRKIGDPATELGLARIADRTYPELLTNYPNQFADGRQVKSTSIGVKDSHGSYIAAVCLNVDLTLFQGIQNALSQFSQVKSYARKVESLDPANAEVIRARIDRFAAALATTPRALRTDERRKLVRELKLGGYMEVRRSTDIVAQHLGVSRATIYSDAK